jgi:hypothetical protein
LVKQKMVKRDDLFVDILAVEFRVVEFIDMQA